MASILAKKNQEFSEKEFIAPSRQEAIREAGEKTLQQYKDYLTSQEAFQVRFTACDKEGTFTALVDGNLILSLSCEDLRRTMLTFRPRDGGNLLGFPFDVKVKAIDEDAGIIYLDSARETPKEKQQILQELKRDISNHQTPLVWGTVNKNGVRGQYALVNVFEAGVLGIIRTENWQKTYLRDLYEVCMEGIPYQYEVIGIRANDGSGRPDAFFLSRKNIEQFDPWNNLRMNGITEGGILVVKCEELPIGKSFWWGRSDRLAGIEIQGDFVKKSKDLKIYPGIRYRCVIKQIVIDPDGHAEKNRFRVYPFGVFEEDLGIYRKTQVLTQPVTQQTDL